MIPYDILKRAKSFFDTFETKSNNKIYVNVVSALILPPVSCALLAWKYSVIIFVVNWVIVIDIVTVIGFFGVS